MKVAVILEGYIPSEGGGFTFQKTIADELSSFGRLENDYWFITPVKDPALPRNIVINLKSFQDRILYSLRRSFPYFSLFNKFQTSLERVLYKNKFDLAYFVTPTGCLINFPYISTVWDLEHRSSPWFPEFSRKDAWWKREANFSWILPRSSFIITGTQTGVNDLIRYYGINPKNVWKIPHPTPKLAPSSKDYSTIYPKPFIFYPAQFWRHKNHHGLIMAFSDFLKDKKINLTLILAGSDKGELLANMSLAKKLGVAEKILFPGFISSDELSWLYENARGMIYPSFCGPENLPPLEALSFGTSVAVAKIEGSEEQLEDNVFYFDPFSKSDICKAINQLCSGSQRQAKKVKDPKEFIETLDKKISSNHLFFHSDCL